MGQRYRLIYESHPGNTVEWDKTAEELLRPNGNLPDGRTATLLDYMLLEADKRGTVIQLESYLED
jgi:hypothetical protein